MVMSASFADPYLAIIRDDSSLLLLQADSSGDIDEVDVNEETAAQKWLSCCLYRDKAGVFSAGPASEKSTQGDLCLFLLSLDSRLFVSSCHCGPVYWAFELTDASDI
jgi:cleavage and polyadenylation specificity factor subunit 1